MLLIFDWDGTLSDSTAKIVYCLQCAAQSTGFPVLSKSALLNIIGLGLPEALTSLYPSLNSSDKELLRLSYVEHFLREDRVASPFYDGVVSGLEELSKAGFTMTVATGKSRRGLDRALERANMQHFFDGSRCADETASKPHPLMINELLSQFNVTPNDAVMVGDTEYDLAMAENAQVKGVAVSYGAHSIDRMEKYKPVLNVDHFSEFTSWALSGFQSS